MVVRQPFDPDTVDRVFAALADPTRRDIVTRVLHRPSSVSALAERYDMSFAAVQRHVAVLERAGLVTKEPHGRERLVRGRVETVRAAALLLEHYEEIWGGRIDRMGDILAEPVTAPRPPPAPPPSPRRPHQPHHPHAPHQPSQGDTP
jgi:DNA-binding transcriptional ArsR family regulator